MAAAHRVRTTHNAQRPTPDAERRAATLYHARGAPVDAANAGGDRPIQGPVAGVGRAQSGFRGAWCVVRDAWCVVKEMSVRKIKAFAVRPGDEDGVNTFLKELAERNIPDTDVDIETVNGSAGEAVVVVIYRTPGENVDRQWAGFIAPQE
ncbi:MAG TPA: hypothetical protein VFI42_11075 [Thermomicrobiaceae bacterium]|nr:hypothetical protein [Thermomicrobiaceae bacterium]